MNILTRYTLRQFLKPFLTGLLVFVFLIAVVHIFEKLEIFTNHKAALSSVVSYVLWQIPSWVVRVTPVSMLLACYFSIGKFSEGGEFTAMQAGGIPPWRVAAPILLLGCVVTMGIFLLQETLAPYGNAQAKLIYKQQIKKQTIEKQTRWVDMIVSGADGWIYTAKAFDLTTGTLERAVITRFEDNQVAEQIDALTGRWDGSQWVFTNGVVRHFSADGVQEEPFQERAITLPETPDDLTPDRSVPEEVNARKLHGSIARLRRLGVPYHKLLVAVQLKYAYPFANLVVLLIGISFSFKVKKLGRMRGFAYSIGLSFCYWALMSVGQVLGESQILSPWAGAWFANIVFAAAGFRMFRRYL